MELFYKEYGDNTGPLILFLHGARMSSWMWEKQIQYFPKYHCMTVDLPEHGESKNFEKFSIELSAEKVINLIQKKSYGRPVTVVGFSIGAQTLIKILSTHSQLIDHAVIISPIVRSNFVLRALVIPFSKILYPLVKNGFLSKIQAKSLYIHDDERFNTYYDESTKISSQSLTRILKEGRSFTIPKEFNEVKSNVLVTVGEKDQLVVKKSVRDIILKNDNCIGILIPRSGYGLSIAFPDFFNVLLENWINEQKIPQYVELIQNQKL